MPGKIGRKHTEETKKKQSDSHKGEKNPMFGIRLVPWNKGKGNPNKKELMRIWRLNNKDKIARWRAIDRENVIKKKYGITKQELDLLKEVQNDLCAICGRAEVSTDKRTGKIINLAIDHCHTTGKVRGLLCFRCNMALGYVSESIKTLEAMIDYVRRHT